MNDKNDYGMVRVYRYSEIRLLAERSGVNITGLVNNLVVKLLNDAGSDGIVSYRSADERDAREEEMIMMRFEKRMTLQEIGDTFGISRERVRQIVGNSDRRHLAAERIRDEVKSVPELTNSEISSVLGISTATVSKLRHGQRYAIDNDDCSLAIGVQKENEYAKKLSEMGMEVELMPYGEKFDAIVNGHRVDFKFCATPNVPAGSVNPSWRFNTKNNSRKNCDFYFCITANDDVFIIPSDKIPQKMNQLVFSYPAKHQSTGKWQKFLNRYDLLEAPHG